MTFDPEPYIRFHRQNAEAEAVAVRDRAVLARQEAVRLAQRILEEVPGVNTVLLFGSVARGDPTSLGFDIDLALDGGDLYRALDVVEDCEFDVDLVSLANLPPAFRRNVEVTGIRFSSHS